MGGGDLGHETGVLKGGKKDINKSNPIRRKIEIRSRFMTRFKRPLIEGNHSSTARVSTLQISF